MTALNVDIAASGDDGFANGTTFDNTNSTMRMGATGSNSQRLFLLFDNITIGQGDTIDDAVVAFEASATRSNTTVNVQIVADDVDDAVAPTDLTEFDAITDTTATVDWDDIPSWTSGTEYTSPEIKTIIQEIVDRAGWTSGNAILLEFRDNGSDSSPLRFREAETHDGTGTVAQLRINYTAGGGTSYDESALASTGTGTVTVDESVSRDETAGASVGTSSVTVTDTLHATESLTSVGTSSAVATDNQHYDETGLESVGTSTTTVTDQLNNGGTTYDETALVSVGTSSATVTATVSMSESLTSVGTASVTATDTFHATESLVSVGTSTGSIAANESHFEELGLTSMAVSVVSVTDVYNSGTPSAFKGMRMFPALTPSRYMQTDGLKAGAGSGRSSDRIWTDDS